MLFDLQGKRRRLVQVVYATLAGLFLIGFVGLGIGSEGSPGGILDAIGLGGDGGSSGSLSDQFDDQIDSANAALAKDPQDTAALLKLSKYEYFKAKQGVTQDQTTGEISVSEDAHTELGTSVDAWEKYLKVNKGKPSPTIATQIVQAYYPLLNDPGGAAQAQRIVVEDQPSSGSYGELAFYLYASFDISGGDQAAKKAVSLAPSSSRKTTQQQLDEIRTQAVKAKKQQAKAQKNAPTTPGSNPLQDPFGGVGAAP